MTAFTWRTGVSADWGAASDWAPAGGPPDADTDSAIIDAPGRYTVAIGSGSAEHFVINTLTLGSAGAKVAVDSGSALILAGTAPSLTVSAGTFELNSFALLQGGTVVPDGGTIVLDANSTLDGVTWLGTLKLSSQDFTVYFQNGLTVETAAGGFPGTIDLSAGNAQLYAQGSEILDNATVDFGSASYGAIDNWRGEGTLTLGSRLTIEQTGGTNYLINSYDGEVIVNEGLVSIGGGALVWENYGFVNTGHVDISGGLMSVQGDSTTFDNFGTITIGSGGELILGGAHVSNAGEIILTREGTLDLQDAVTLSDGTLSDAGMIVNNGGLPKISGFLDLHGGTLTVPTSGFFSNISVTDGGTLAGGTVLPNGGSISLLDGATLADVTWLGTLMTSGQIMVAAGSDVVLTTVAGTGTMAIGAGATLELNGPAANSAVLFEPGGAATLRITDLLAASTGQQDFRSTISGLAPGDMIDISSGGIGTFVAITDAVPGAYDASTETTPLMLFDNAELVGELSLGGDYAAGSFAVSQNSALFSVTEAIPCFRDGTRILTDRGEVPVESLTVGDRVVSRGGEARPIVWIGKGHALVTRGRRNAATPVIIREGALGDNVPHRDLHVTKGHSLYLDGILIPAEFLINHRSIVWDDRAQEVSVYHVELDTHDVLFANGALAVSYRDDGNRWLFRNANTGWHLPPTPACAPVLTGGPAVDAVWRRLLERAGGPMPKQTTEEEDLHLVVDGVRIGGTTSPGRLCSFRLPTPLTEVRVVSRAAVPSELGLARDPRRLGVALRKILVWQGPRVRLMEASDPSLEQGFHSFEPDNGFRWTNGNACLPAALFAGLSGAIELVLHIGCTTVYPVGEEIQHDKVA